MTQERKQDIPTQAIKLARFGRRTQWASEEYRRLSKESGGWDLAAWLDANRDWVTSRDLPQESRSLDSVLSWLNEHELHGQGAVDSAAEDLRRAICEASEMTLAEFSWMSPERLTVHLLRIGVNASDASESARILSEWHALDMDGRVAFQRLAIATSMR
jgi:hypothetical protein